MGQISLKYIKYNKYSSINEAIEITGIKHISDCCNGRRNSTGGYIFVFALDICYFFWYNINMKSEYTLVIISKALRPMYLFRYYIVKQFPYENILSTDSLYEVKMWLDLRGLKFNKFKQYEYHFKTGIDGVQLMIVIKFEFWNRPKKDNSYNVSYLYYKKM